MPKRHSRPSEHALQFVEGAMAGWHGVHSNNFISVVQSSFHGMRMIKDVTDFEHFTESSHFRQNLLLSPIQPCLDF